MRSGSISDWRPHVLLERQIARAVSRDPYAWKCVTPVKLELEIRFRGSARCGLGLQLHKLPICPLRLRNAILGDRILTRRLGDTFEVCDECESRENRLVGRLTQSSTLAEAPLKARSLERQSPPRSSTPRPPIPGQSTWLYLTL